MRDEAAQIDDERLWDGVNWRMALLRTRRADRRRVAPVPTDYFWTAPCGVDMTR